MHESVHFVNNYNALDGFRWRGIVANENETPCKFAEKRSVAVVASSVRIPQGSPDRTEVGRVKAGSKVLVRTYFLRLMPDTRLNCIATQCKYAVSVKRRSCIIYTYIRGRTHVTKLADPSTLLMFLALWHHLDVHFISYIYIYLLLILLLITFTFMQNVYWNTIGTYIIILSSTIYIYIYILLFLSL